MDLDFQSAVDAANVEVIRLAIETRLMKQVFDEGNMMGRVRRRENRATPAQRGAIGI